MEVGYYQDRSQRLLRERVQSRWMDAYSPARHIDPILIAVALTLTVVGLVVIYSAKQQALILQGLPTDFYVTQQLIAMAVGLGAMFAAAAIDYRWLRSYSALVYLVGIALLAAVLTPLGVTVNGSQGWFRFAGFQFQPAELAKVSLIVGLSALLHERKGEPGAGTVGTSLLLAAVPVGLVFLQPDLGSALVLIWIAFVVLLVGGVRIQYLLGLTVAGVAGFVGVLRFTDLVQDHALERLTCFLDPANTELVRGACYNINQSLIAVGSGEFFGKGLLNGTQTGLSFVPENHTDFIFTVIGEELGFVGGAVVLGLFVVLLWRGLRIALMAKDLFGTLIAAGIVAVISIQLFVTVGMTIGLFPITGIPLPFVSYGGSSLILSFGLVGLLQNIHMRRF